MSTDLYVAMAGAMARLEELDVIANNLANGETVGYRRDRTGFVAALEAGLRDVDGARTAGASARVFAAATGRAPDLATGAVLETGAPLDVAIKGPGFFEIDAPQGTRYTRAGAFIVKDGVLATADGHPVRGDGGPIALGSGAAEIRSSGEVVDSVGEVLGTLKLVAFEPGDLLKDGGNLLRAAEGAAPGAVEEPAFVERSVERSNVRPVEELAGLVLVQRSFEVVMRALQADDAVRQRLIREVSS